MRILTMEITGSMIEEGFKTGNTMQHTVVNKGLPNDAKLIGARLNRYGHLVLRFESERQEGEEKNIVIGLTTMRDA